MDIRSLQPERIKGDISKALALFPEGLSFYSLDSYSDETGTRLQGIVYWTKRKQSTNCVPLDILKQCIGYSVCESFDTLVWTLWF